MNDEKNQGNQNQPRNTDLNYFHIMDEYPNELEQLISAFTQSVARDNHKLEMDHALYAQAMAKIKNIDASFEAGIITMEEKLTALMSLPMVTMSSMKPLEYKTAKFKHSFHVSAHKVESSELKAGATTTANVNVSGLGAALAGVGGSFGLKASTAYKKNNSLDTKVDNLVDVDIELGYGETPPGIELIQDFGMELARAARDCNVAILKKQQDKLTASEADTDAPTELPESEDANGNSNSNGDGNGDGDADNDAEGDDDAG